MMMMRMMMRMMLMMMIRSYIEGGAGDFTSFPASGVHSSEWQNDSRSGNELDGSGRGLTGLLSWDLPRVPEEIHESPKT
jgi:hypothetical protein